MKIMNYYMKDDIIRGAFEEAKKLSAGFLLSPEAPFVDIEKIASEMGLKVIYDASIGDVHARLDVDTIKLNPKDDKSQQRFSIAHEIAHIIAKDTLEVTVRSDESSGLKISYSFTNRELKDVARNFDNTQVLGGEFSSPNRDSTQLAKDFYEETIDYFAASLLVPSDLFCTLFDKSNEELAGLFGVKEECIAKRRKELVYEMEVFAKPNAIKHDVEADCLAEQDVAALIEGL